MLLTDLRYALRLLAKQPALTLAVVLLLALGLGASTTIFTLLNAILIRLLPGIAAPERLVMLGRTHQGQGFDPSSYPNYRDYRDQNSVFSGVCAFDHTAFSLSSAGVTERAQGAVVSGNYFEVLGVRPAAGRFFLPQEDQAPGRDLVAVISHRLWQGRFGADPAVVGSKLLLNARPFTVVGVAGQGFLGARTQRPVDVWVPIMAQAHDLSGPQWREQRRANWLDLIARLKPGLEHGQAAANLATIARRLEAAYPKENKSKGIVVAPYHPLGPDAARDTGAMLGILTAVTGLVLLVACANVANLLLAQASTRRREIAIRLALGAGRARLVRQLLVEGLLLAFAGGLASLLVAMWGAEPIFTLFPPSEGVPVPLDLSPDARVAAYAAALAALSALVFGLAPAWQASRPDLTPALKAGEGAIVGRRSRFSQGLVVFQVALCAVLLVGAGLFERTLGNLRSIDPQMKTDNMLLLSLAPALNGYQPPAARQLYAQLLERIGGLPGVVSVTTAQIVPFSQRGLALGRLFAGAAEQGEGLQADCNLVGPGYLGAMGIPLIAGRDFERSDRDGAPRVAIINQNLARRLWPDQNPLGQPVRIGKPDSEPWQIVGVAQDSRYRSAVEKVRPFYYLPSDQLSVPGFTALTLDRTLHMRTAGNPLPLIEPVRRVVRGVDPHLPLYDIKTLDAHLDASFWPQRLAATLVGLFSLLATVMATLGLYAVMANHVARRTREIGLRMALGATPPAILRATLRRGLAVAAGGLAAGLLVALVAARLLGSLLYGVKPADPLTFAGVAGLLVAVALAACYLPARRATRVDPAVALRHE
jgi:predicted permease